MPLGKHSLNYFSMPHAEAPDRENRLTVGLLTLLRIVPGALDEFIAYVRARQLTEGYTGKHVLPSPSSVDEPVEVETQTGKLDLDKEYGVSTAITDRDLSVSGTAGKRDRGAVYDGVITFPNHLLVIENKPYGNLAPSQLDLDFPDEVEQKAAPIKLGPKLILVWTTLFDRLLRLQDRRLLGPSGDRLLGDFYAYVEEHFPALTPYDTLDRAAPIPSRIARRCGMVLESAYEGQLDVKPQDLNANLDISPDPIIRRIGLDPVIGDGNAVGRISLSLHPGDTMSQAKELYSRAGVDFDGLLRLADEPGWKVRPNFHLNFASLHFGYTHDHPSLADYIEFWSNHRDRFASEIRGKQKIQRTIRWLVETEQMDKYAIEGYEEAIEETDRTKIRLCPGISVFYRWPFEKAAELDEVGGFVDEVRAKVKRVLSLVRQEVPSVPTQEAMNAGGQ
jgi:hypothetical protein